MSEWGSIYLYRLLLLIIIYKPSGDCPSRGSKESILETAHPRVSETVHPVVTIILTPNYNLKQASFGIIRLLSPSLHSHPLFLFYLFRHSFSISKDVWSKCILKQFGRLLPRMLLPPECSYSKMISVQQVTFPDLLKCTEHIVSVSVYSEQVLSSVTNSGYSPNSNFRKNPYNKIVKNWFQSMSILQQYDVILALVYTSCTP